MTDEPTGPAGTATTWTVGQKFGFGTVCDHDATDPSRVWFTLTAGAVTELRFPRIDVMSVRSLDFLVTDGERTWRTLRERRDRPATVDRSAEAISDEALLFRQTATPTDDAHDWRLVVEHATHPDTDALCLDVAFEGEGYDVYAVLDPALAGYADHDAAEARDGALLAALDRPEEPDDDAVFRTIEGEPGAEPDTEPIEAAAALTGPDGFEWTTADVREGAVEQALLSSGSTDRRRDEATGNVVLAGRLPDGGTTLSLGFAEGDADEALAAARTALSDPFEVVQAAYADSWRAYLGDVAVPDSVTDDTDLLAQYRTAVMVLKAADSKRFPGAGIASPSVPWGDAVVATDPVDYGYNYVWPRDLYHAYTAFDAVGDTESAVDATEYLYRAQQRDDGFLPQNTFLTGRTRWDGEQMDEIAVPAVMAQQLKARHGYGLDEADYGYADVARSSDYLVATGPYTEQERWEEESGYSPSSTAAQIAGLVCAADLALDAGERADAIAYLGVADHWVRHLEEWHATGTGTDEHTRTPYYVRITEDGNPDDGALRTHANGGGTYDERGVLDGGFLELVRLGITPADDPVIRNSVAEYDDDIMVETPHGPAWYRYTGDGYGEKEHQSGAPWQPDMTGKGRLWPFFTGERAEYELRRDDPDLDPEALLATLAGFANEGRMLPEQVWDEPGDNAFDWTFGEGTSAATPLCWTNAQFVRLAWSLDAGEPVETPAVVADRYGGDPPAEGPSLDVTVDRDGDSARVTASTEGEELVVKTASETAHATGDGVTLTVAVGADERVTVVGATGDLPEVTTSVRVIDSEKQV